MSIERTDFDQISVNDLYELVESSIPEGQYIEYKSQIYKRTDAGKKEYLNDVTAFANSHGGHLLIGIEEKKGIATSVSGIKTDNIDVTKQWLENVMREGIEPRIIGIRIRCLLLTNGNHVIVIRIPRSWNLPHRVRAYNSNRFWIRNSAGKHEASMDELRSFFVMTSDIIEKIRSFRNERVQLIQDSKGACPLESGGRFILHFIPFSSFSLHVNIDMEKVYENRKYFGLFDPSGSRDTTYNFDGVITETSGSHNKGYTQVFRNGIIEVTKAKIVYPNSDFLSIGGVRIEEQFFTSLPMYLKGLKIIGVSPPIAVLITLEGIQDVKYVVYDEFFTGKSSKPFDRPLLLLPECIIEEYGSDRDYNNALRPAFDALWNSAGFNKDKFIKPDGEWSEQ